MSITSQYNYIIKFSLIIALFILFGYTGCLILNNALRFLENYDKYGKMFQTKVGSEGSIRKYH